MNRNGGLNVESKPMGIYTPQVERIPYLPSGVACDHPLLYMPIHDPALLYPRCSAEIDKSRDSLAKRRSFGGSHRLE
jgi:hypothetical protein